jgi:serine/threonine protein kinase
MACKIIAKKYRLDSVYRDTKYFTIYRGWDEEAGRPIGIKELKLNLFSKEEAQQILQIFIQEIKFLKNLNSPLFPSYYDLITIGESCYLIMEWIEGKDLKKVKDETPKLDQQAALWYLEKISGAWVLLQMMDPPVIGVDLKPSDLVVDRNGNVRFLDFSSRKIASHIQGKTPGIFKFSNYAAQEIHVDESLANLSSDVFSLGSIMYFMVTNEELSQGEEEYQSPSKYNPDLEGWFCQLILDCLKTQGQRIQNMEELQKRVDKVHREEDAKKAAMRKQDDALESPILTTVVLGIFIILQIAAYYIYSNKISLWIPGIITLFAGPYILVYTIYNLTCIIQTRIRGLRIRPKAPVLFMFTSIGCVITLIGFGIYYFSAPTFKSTKAYGKLIGCENNCKNISIALEYYARDHKDKGYPDSLKEVIPKYLKSVPVCPSTGMDTYSVTYKNLKNQGSYIFYCNGENHKDALNVGGNYPQYSHSGLIERPGDEDLFLRAERREPDKKEPKNKNQDGKELEKKDPKNKNQDRKEK